MAKTETTVKGYVYTVTSPNGGTVTDAEGKLSKTVDAGDQVTVTAPSDSLTCDDDAAVICKANFKSPLLALRLLGQGEHALPAGYTRVEFLESTGTQYIDTGILLNSESDVSTRAYATLDDGGYLFGSMDVVERRRLLALGSSNFKPAIFSGYGNNYRYSYDIDTFVPHEYRFNGRTLTVDGEPLETYGEVPYFESTTPCYLFAYNRLAVGVDGRGKSRVMWVRIEGQAHFVPSLDPSGEPCMYDLVSKQAFKNDGSGQFVAGMTLNQVRGLRLPAGGGELTLSLPHEASIDRLAQAALERARANGWELTLQYAEAEVPAGYRRLEFLESTGTQYIDTGVKLSSESEVESRYIAFDDGNEKQTNYYLLGSRDAYNKNAFDYMAFYRPYGLAIAYCGGDGTTARSRNIINTTALDTVHILKQNANYIKVDELVFSYPTDLTPFECLNNCLLGSKYGGATGSNLVGRIYSFTISRAGVAQVDYVPCIAPDGKLGMYNKVDGSLKENAGGGAFIAGLATVDDVRKLWLPETGGELTVSVPADTPDSAVEQLRSNNPTWQIAIQYRTDNENQ